MKRILFPILVILALHCGDDGIDPSTPFVCTPDLCPQGSCKIEIEFSESCSGQLQNAEVLINNNLEPTAAIIDATFVSMGDIPAHSHSCATHADCVGGMKCTNFICQSEVWIQSEDWRWGPFNPVCSNASENQKLPTLACKSANPEG